MVECKREENNTIADNWKPIERIVPAEGPTVFKRIGIARRQFEVPDDFDAGNEEIAAMVTENK